jgi:4-carboxymuconolactone decarboxylase
LTEARIPTIGRHEDLPAADQHFYDRIVRTRGGVPAPYRVLLHSPHVADRVASVGDLVLYDASLPPQLRALVGLVVAAAFECEQEWQAWEPRARQAGLPDVLIRAIRDEAGLPPCTVQQGVLIEFCRQLLQGNHHVDEAVYQAAVREFGLPVTVKITAAMGYLVMLALVLNAFEVRPDAGDPELPL